MSIDESTQKAELAKRLENVGWAALLIVVGTIGLLPGKVVPKGSWLIAAGIILLALNIIRYINRIEMKGLSLVVGILALFAGLGAAFGVDLPLFAISLIVIGLCILLKPLIEGHAVTGCCGSAERAIGR